MVPLRTSTHTVYSLDQDTTTHQDQNSISINPCQQQPRIVAVRRVRNLLPVRNTSCAQVPRVCAGCAPVLTCVAAALWLGRRHTYATGARVGRTGRSTCVMSCRVCGFCQVVMMYGACDLGIWSTFVWSSIDRQNFTSAGRTLTQQCLFPVLALESSRCWRC